ncbi:MAG: response regulator transcription factor [Mucilaginibacter polytrichastri]|nr:response regulator transcription factor [Mucilaginibacter polytrichastri]
MRCLLVDDEKLALELMADNIARINFLEVSATCRNAVDALTVLHQQPIDLVFLDIQMPGISGLQFLQSLPNPPLTILVTAYEQHALEGFDLNVVDYLLKPVSFERFLKAAGKAVELFRLRAQSRQSEQNGQIFVNAGYSLVNVNVEDILFIEGLKDYVKIHLKNAKPVVTRASLHSLVEKLPAGKFMRVHRSYIVAMKHIGSVQKQRFVIDGQEIPIGELYREPVQAYIDGHNL